MGRTLTIVAAALFAGIVIGEGSVQEPRVRIDSPNAKDYVTGEIVISVSIEPGGDRLSSVAISVDGVPTCTRKAAPFECGYNAGPELRPRVIRAVATFVSGVRAVHTIATSSVQVSETTGVESVLVGVTVVDRRGRFVPGLGKERFRLFDNGKPSSISFFAPEGWPLELVLAVDISGSMQKSLPAVRRAAAAFLDALRPTDHVALAAFNSSFFVLAPRDAPPEVRQRALDRLAPWGGTSLFDSLLASLDLLQDRDGRRAVVVFTDGEDRTSEAAIGAVEQRLMSDNVLLYVVGLGSASELPALRITLDGLAQSTGGRALFITDVEKAAPAFKEIVGDLSMQYTLGFTPESQASAPSWRPLRVELVGGGFTVRARPGYALKRKEH